MLAHLLFRSAGLPARDNFRRPCVYHYPVDRRSSQNYFFTFCSVSLYGFQGTMLSVRFSLPCDSSAIISPLFPFVNTFLLPRLSRLFSVFSFISFTFLSFSLHSSNKYIKILAEYLLFFYYFILVQE